MLALELAFDCMASKPAVAAGYVSSKRPLVMGCADVGCSSWTWSVVKINADLRNHQQLN